MTLYISVCYIIIESPHNLYTTLLHDLISFIVMITRKMSVKLDDEVVTPTASHNIIYTYSAYTNVETTNKYHG